MCEGQGLGRARHVQTRSLWLQQAVAGRRGLGRKVQGTVDPADILTKYLAYEPAVRMAELLGIELVWRLGSRGAQAEAGCED